MIWPAMLLFHAANDLQGAKADTRKTTALILRGH